jgi:DNA-binding MarR family transcriptional regulator
MADINSDAGGAPRARTAGRTGEPGSDIATPDLDEASIGLVEMLFFAYRDFTGEADAVLEAYGFGRAHHRVLHFVNRRPGLRVADLLEILRITKQSLARVLKQLVDRGFIEQAEGADDRRARHLFLTDQGKALATRLARLQIDQVGRALAASGTGSEPAVQAFLTALIAESRADVAAAPAPHAEARLGRAGPRDTRSNEP